MSNIYDESGTVVATHPIQEAQHDGVTVIGRAANNVPERIELGRGWTLLWDETEGVIFKNHGGIQFGVGTRNARPLFEAISAMQPQVSENDEAVAREIFNKCCMPDSRYERGDTVGFEFAIGECAKILAKHRQPAVVSADAVELETNILSSVPRSYDPATQRDRETVRAIIQAYGDACRLDGARKMQEAALNHIKLVWKNFGDPAYHGKGNSIMGGFEERFACNQCETAMAALSPETVCGGE